MLYTNERGNEMNIADKRERLVRHFTEAYNAEELAEMLMENYTDEDVDASYEMFNEED